MKVIFKTDNTELSKLGIGIINTYSFQYVPKCVNLNFNQVYYKVLLFIIHHQQHHFQLMSNALNII